VQGYASPTSKSAGNKEGLCSNGRLAPTRRELSASSSGLHAPREYKCTKLPRGLGVPAKSIQANGLKGSIEHGWSNSPTGAEVCSTLTASGHNDNMEGTQRQANKAPNVTTQRDAQVEPGATARSRLLNSTPNVTIIFHAKFSFSVSLCHSRQRILTSRLSSSLPGAVAWPLSSFLGTRRVDSAPLCRTFPSTGLRCGHHNILGLRPVTANY
jgi:hypothetical protein